MTPSQRWPAIVGMAEPSAGPFVTIHLRDIAGTAAKEGGAAGALAARLAPKTVEARAYDQMREQILKNFTDRGVAADVAVVATVPPGGPLRSVDFYTGLAVGAGTVGIGALLWKFLRRDA